MLIINCGFTFRHLDLRNPCCSLCLNLTCPKNMTFWHGHDCDRLINLKYIWKKMPLNKDDLFHNMYQIFV